MRVLFVPRQKAKEVNVMKNRRQQRGFTLIEMLIVIIVIAVLAAVVVPKVVNVVGLSKTNAGTADLRTLNDALVRVQADAGSCPADAATAGTWLTSATKPASWPAAGSWTGPYINSATVPTSPVTGSAFSFDTTSCRYS